MVIAKHNNVRLCCLKDKTWRVVVRVGRYSACFDYTERPFAQQAFDGLRRSSYQRVAPPVEFYRVTVER